MEDPWQPPEDLAEPASAFELEEPPGFEEPPLLEPGAAFDPADGAEAWRKPQEAFPDGLRARAKRPRAVVFTLGGADFAVGVEQVVEIESLRDVAELPNVPDWILGVTQLRGEIVSVVDLRRFTGLPAGAATGEPRILVVRAASGNAVSAFAVDRVVGIRELGPRSPPDRTPPVPEALAPFSSGARRIEGHPLRIIDLAGLLASPVLRGAG